MPVTPKHALSLELNYLRETIVASEAWRAVVASPLADWPALEILADAATSSEANARTAVIRERTDETTAVSNTARAIVRHLSEGDIEKLGSGSSWNTEGTLMMLFELPIPTSYQGEDKIDDAVIAFENTVGRIIEEMQVAAGTAGKLNITRIGRTIMGQIDPVETNGELIRMVEYTVSFLGGV